MQGLRQGRKLSPEHLFLQKVRQCLQVDGDMVKGPQTNDRRLLAGSSSTTDYKAYDQSDKSLRGLLTSRNTQYINTWGKKESTFLQNKCRRDVELENQRKLK